MAKIAAIMAVIMMFFGCAQAEDVIGDMSVLTDENNEHEESLLTEIEYAVPLCETPQAAVTNYFAALYDSYVSMLPIDISTVADFEHDMMLNVQNWSTLLSMRRSIILENGYCYVETECFPYIIEYITEKELNDVRMDDVDMSDYGDGAVALHFVIKGVKGKAYPPIFAVNSQHSMVLTFKDGYYKVAYHYFPGSEGKFQNDFSVELMEKAEMEELLRNEFVSDEKIPDVKPIFSREYNKESAVEYALEFCEKTNKKFYFVGDWYGNCMNFSSQCIWNGFRKDGENVQSLSGMTEDWYCNKKGGTLIWASVGRFWNWIKSEECDMQTVSFNNVNLARNGNIVNIGSYLCEEKEKYTHALVVVDEQKLLLAQNSPGCFVYYSDLVNNYSRFIRPISLNA